MTVRHVFTLRYIFFSPFSLVSSVVLYIIRKKYIFSLNNNNKNNKTHVPIGISNYHASTSACAYTSYMSRRALPTTHARDVS